MMGTSNLPGVVGEAISAYGRRMRQSPFDKGIEESKQLYRLIRAQAKVGDRALVQSLLELPEPTEDEVQEKVQELIESGELPDYREEHRAKMRELFLNMEELVGRKFASLREERGWSQHDVAVRMTDVGFNMHQTTVAKLEGGKRPLRFAEMAALSSIYGLPLEAVLYLPEFKMAPDVEYMAKELERIREREKAMEDQTFDFIKDRVQTLAQLGVEKRQTIAAMRAAGAEIDAEFEGDDGEHPEDA